MTIPTTTPLLYDRSGVELDWRCQRAHYWNRIYGRRGIVPTGPDEDLQLGVSIHDTLGSAIAAGGSLTVLERKIRHYYAEMLKLFETSPPARGEVEDLARYAYERAALVEGFARGWWRLIWPQMQARYKIERVEKEALYEREGTIMSTTPDLLVTELDSELMGYVEWKSTGLNTAGWFDGWNYAAQLQSGAAAVLQSTGKKVDFAIVQGLYKGAYQGGWQHSPFCYCWLSAYKNGDLDRPGHDLIHDVENNIVVATTYKAGARWARMATWEMPHGLAWLVEQMPIEVLVKQFPVTPPIMINPEKVEDFFDQTIPRVKDIADGRLQLQIADRIQSEPLRTAAARVVLNAYFKQNTHECVPAIGRKCAFHRCCHTPIGDDPIGSGYYQLRTPHHQLERAHYGLAEQEKEKGEQS